MKKTPLLAAALGALVITGALAGCTANSNTSTKTPAPSTSQTAGPSGNATAKADSKLETEKKLQAEQENPTGACIDGQAVVNSTDKKITVGDCKTISILGSGATVTLGTVEHLIIENNKNTITAKSIAAIDSIGHDNTITYGGTSDAKVTDQGSGNTITRK